MESHLECSFFFFFLDFSNMSVFLDLTLAYFFNVTPDIGDKKLIGHQHPKISMKLNTPFFKVTLQQNLMSRLTGPTKS